MAERKTILFVEDWYVSIKDIWEEILDNNPEWLPDHCTSVQDAWQYLCEQRVHAIILDVMLPAVDGVHPKEEGLYLVAWIQGKKQAGAPPFYNEILEGNRNVPICFFTARTEVQVRPFMQELGIQTVELFEKSNTDNNKIINWLKNNIE